MTVVQKDVGEKVRKIVRSFLRSSARLSVTKAVALDLIHASVVISSVQVDAQDLSRVTVW